VEGGRADRNKTGFKYISLGPALSPVEWSGGSE